jgi:nucleoside-diphosphate-sugar epimerase
MEHLSERTAFEFALGSICKPDVVHDVVSGAHTVFHLAAAVEVQLIIEQPLRLAQRRNSVTEGVAR